MYKKERAITKEEKEAGEGYFSSKHIISNIDKFSYFIMKYILIGDFSTKDHFFSLIKAINLLAEKGWRCVNITHAIYEGSVFDHGMYALMEKVE